MTLVYIQEHFSPPVSSMSPSCPLCPPTSNDTMAVVTLEDGKQKMAGEETSVQERTKDKLDI